MWPTSSVFGQAIRDAHTMVVTVDAWYNGSPLVENMPIDGGSVRVSSGIGVRRTLDLTISDRSLWDTLDVTGIELYPYRGVRYPSGEVETVPLGVFGLDSQAMSLAPSGGIQVRSAPDRWARIQRAAFETPQTSQAGQFTVNEIARLAVQAIPNVEVLITATSTATVGALVYDRDRAKQMSDLATGISAEVFFDNLGRLIVRDAPLLSQTPVWTVDASPTGVLLDGERIRERSRTYSVVVVTDARTEGSVPFAPQVVADLDPTSRTYVNGPFGRVPYFWSSPSIRTAAQASAAAATLLNRVKAVNAQIDVESVVHPALDRGDVITVVTPDTTELHLVDAVTVPLTVSGTQQITTRSSRPEGDVPAGE